MRRPDFWKGPYWEPRDIWWGVYWDRDWYQHGATNSGPVSRRLRVWACLIPCFPVQMTWMEPGYQDREAASYPLYYREWMQRQPARPEQQQRARGED